MTAEGGNGGFDDEKPADMAGDDGPRRPQLRALTGPVEHSSAPPPPSVRLVREYKGLTVADMMRDEIVDRLPGQVRSALHHLQRGDYAAAEQALPGEFSPVLEGPGARRHGWPQHWLWLIITAVLVAAAMLSWWS